MRQSIRTLTIWISALLVVGLGIAPAHAQRGALSVGGEGYATIEDGPGLNMQGDEYALEVWVKHDGQSNEDAIILTKGSEDLANHYTLRFEGAGEEVPVRFEVRYGGGIVSTSGIPAHRWTHIAAVYDGSELQLYINGELDAADPHGRELGTNDSPLRIGTNNSANGQFFSGQIDELRLWGAARTLFEVRDSFFEQLDGTEAGLLAYWDFDGETPLASEAGLAFTLEGDAEVVAPGTFPVPPDLYALSGNGQVELTWAERQNEDEAAQFKLYRSTDPEGSDRQELATIDGETTSYTDTDVDNGTTYFYEVTAIDGDGLESGFSAAAWVQPYTTRGGQALTLGGQGYAWATNRPSLNLTGTEFAFEVWVKHDGQSDEDAIILTKGTEDLASHYTLFFVGQGEEAPVGLNVRYGGVLVSNSGIPAHRWTHIAAVYNGTQLAIYINGKLDATDTFSRELGTNESPLRIGTNNSANGRFFSGQIDEIRIWSNARTPEEIEENYLHPLTGMEEGLRAYWRFEGEVDALTRGAATTHQGLELTGDAEVAPGGVAPVVPNIYAVRGDGQVDVAWAQRTGTDEAAQFKLYRSTDPEGSDRQELATIDGETTSYTDTDVDNGTTYFYEVTAIDAEGQESDYPYPAFATPSENANGNALHLDGDGDFARVADRPSLNLRGKEFAVEAWVRHDGQSDEDAIIFEKGDSDEHSRYMLRLEGQGEEVLVRFAARYNTGVTSETALPAGVWTHVAGVYDGSQLTLYIDGELDATSSFDRDRSTNDMPLTIGSNAAGDGAFFSGAIDEIRLWNDVRTLEEILATRDSILLGNEQGLVAYWRFNETGGSTASSSTGRPKTAMLHGDASFTESTAIPVEEGAPELPTAVELKGNYPNPFNPQTTIRYALPEATAVHLAVYDALGRQVAVLVDGHQQAAGTHEVAFEAHHLASGLYLYRLQAGDQVKTGNMTLIK